VVSEEQETANLRFNGGIVMGETKLSNEEIEREISEIAEKIMDLSAYAGGMEYSAIWERIKKYMES
jgi:hypothetical protein